MQFSNLVLLMKLQSTTISYCGTMFFSLISFRGDIGDFKNYLVIEELCLQGINNSPFYIYNQFFVAARVLINFKKNS